MTALIVSISTSEGATADTTPDTPTATEGYISTVTICVDGACAPYDGAAPTGAVAATTTSPVAVSPMSTAPPSGGSYTNVYCNHSYAWSDGDGSFTYQHACGGSTSPWGYTLSTRVKAIITGPVNEAGMSWYRNGAKQPKQAGHTGVSKSYQFHGTFNPVKKGDGIEYSDTISFKCTIGDNCTGSVHIYGALRQVT